MPIITIKLIVEKETECSKHLFNHEDFEVYSTKEEDNTFTLVAKQKQVTLTN